VKLLWINPIATNVYDEPIRIYLESVKEPGTEINVVSFPPPGPTHLEYNCYEMWMMPQLLRTVRWAEQQGYDAAVIGCFYDPGLRAARELTQRMVVTAPAEACLRIAATLGESMAILVGRQKWIPEMKENVHKYGYKEKLAAFKVLNMGVHDFQMCPSETKRRILEAAREAVERDGADVIVLGCTAEFGFYQEIQKEIGVPVVDAVVAPVKFAEFLVKLRQLGWGHSKRMGYEGPPESELNSWAILGPCR
jgi:Hydantoin racemase